MDILKEMEKFTSVSKLAYISLAYLKDMKKGSDEDKEFYNIIFANIVDEAKSNWLDVIALIKNDESFNLNDFIYKNYINYFHEKIYQIIDDFSNEKNYKMVQDFTIEVRRMIKLLQIMHDGIYGHRQNHAISTLTFMAMYELDGYIYDFWVEYMKLGGITVNSKRNT